MKLNKATKIVSLLIAFLLLISCKHNIISNGTASDFVVKGHLDYVGDVQKESGSERSAFPENPTTVYYKVYAQNQTLEKIDGEVSGSDFTISLPTGVWEIYALGYSQPTLLDEDLILAGSKTVNLADAPEDISALSITVYGVLGNTQGKVNLAVTVEDATKVPYAEAVWGTHTQTMEFSSGSTTTYFTMDDSGETPASLVDVDSGTYEVQFNFYDSNGTGKKLLYSFTQNVKVFANLTTNTWVGAASYINSLNNEIYITASMVTWGVQKDYFVSSIGNNDGFGDFFDPFKSIQKAVEVIQSINDGSTYNIYLLSDINGSSEDYIQSFEGGTFLGNSFVDINPATALKLNIKSYGSDSPYKINANADLYNFSRVMYIGEKADVTLENVDVCGGYIDYSGAGIYLRGKLTFESGYIRGNSTGTNCNGGGVFATVVASVTNKPEFVMNGGTIGGDTSADGNFSSHGGAIAIENGIININGGKIYNNSATITGGGIWYKGSNCYLSNVEFCNNTARNGGGFMTTNGTSTFGDGVIFNGNTAQCSGGAIFIYMNSTLNVEGDVLISNNSANCTYANKVYVGGGGIFMENSFLNVGSEAQVYIEDNTSGCQGGGIFIDSTDAYAANNVINLENLIIRNNKTENLIDSYTESGKTIYLAGGGLAIGHLCGYVDATKNSQTAISTKLTLTNCTITGNNDGITNAHGNDIFVDKDNELVISNTVFDEIYLTNKAVDVSDSLNNEITIKLGEEFVPEDVVVKQITESQLENIKTVKQKDKSLKVKYSSGNAVIYSPNPNGGNFETDYEITATVAELTAAGQTPETGCVYSIATEAELTQLSTWVAGSGSSSVFANITFVLTDNVKLTSEFTPIGTKNSPNRGFCGVFDGNGNTISGLNVTGTNKYAALFGYLNKGTIKNVHVKGKVFGSSDIAGIVGYAIGGEINNCVSEVEVISSSSTGVGGIIGETYSNTNIKNCVNLGTITTTGSSSCLAGIAGIFASGTIENCVNLGSILGAGGTSVGGIAGNVTATGTYITNSYNAGLVRGTGVSNGSVDSSTSGNATYTNVYWMTGTYESPFSNASATKEGVTEISTNNINDLQTSLDTYAADHDGLNSWNYSYKVGHKAYPVCVNFSGAKTWVPEVVLPSQSVKEMTDAPDDTSMIYVLEDLDDVQKLVEWVNTDGNSMEDINFQLTTGLDLQLPDGQNWQGIGTEEHPFKGIFDGNYNSVTNLLVSTGTYEGLFGYVEDAVISNLYVRSNSLQGQNDAYVGGVIGYSKGSLVIDNVVSALEVQANGAAYTGGIIAYVDGGPSDTIIIRNCFIQGSVSGKNYVGGIVGYISANPGSVTIENCGKISNLTGTEYMGGILGYSENIHTNITNCVVQLSNNPTGTNDGAIAGYIISENAGVISNCYACAVGGTASLWGSASGGVDTSSCYKIAYSNAGDGSGNTICVLLNSDNSLTTINSLAKMNEWCETNSSDSVLYYPWKYTTSSGAIGMDN